MTEEVGEDILGWIDAVACTREAEVENPRELAERTSVLATRANFERRASKSAKSVNNATKEQHHHCCAVDQHIASKEQREVNISAMIMR